MRIKTLSVEQYKYIFFTLLAISFLSLATYIYAVNQTVRNIVARQSMEAELMALTSEIGEMEFEYIAEKNQISLEKAFSMGFKQVQAETFVSRQSSVAFANLGQSN